MYVNHWYCSSRFLWLMHVYASFIFHTFFSTHLSYIILMSVYLIYPFILFPVIFHHLVCATHLFQPTYLVPSISLVGNQCQPGSFCVEGSWMEDPCPPGYYLPSPRAKNITYCLLCTPGKFCNSSGLPQPQGPCSPGEWPQHWTSFD